MKNKSLPYIVGGVLVAVLVGAAIYFGGGEQFQGALVKKVPLLKTPIRVTSPTEPKPATPVTPPPQEQPPATPPTTPVQPQSFSGNAKVMPGPANTIGAVVRDEDVSLFTAYVSASEQITMKGMSFQVTNPAAVKQISLYRNGEKLPGSVVPMASGVIQFIDANFTVSPNDSNQLSVHAIINSVVSSGKPDSGETVKMKFVSLDNAVTSTGYNVASMMTKENFDAFGPEYLLRVVKPIVTQNAMSPNQTMIPGTMTVLSFNIEAKGEDHILLMEDDAITLQLKSSIAGKSVPCTLAVPGDPVPTSFVNWQSASSENVKFPLMQNIKIDATTKKKFDLKCDMSNVFGSGYNQFVAEMSAFADALPYYEGGNDRVTDGALIDALSFFGPTIIGPNNL